MSIEVQFQTHRKKVVKRKKKITRMTQTNRTLGRIDQEEQKVVDFQQLLAKARRNLAMLADLQTEYKETVLWHTLVLPSPNSRCHSYNHKYSHWFFLATQGNQQTNTLSIITFSIWLWMQGRKRGWVHKFDRRCYVVSGKNIAYCYGVSQEMQE